MTEMTACPLKPCPFCHGDGETEVDENRNHFVSCRGCRAEGSRAACAADAIAAWNTHPDSGGAVAFRCVQPGDQVIYGYHDLNQVVMDRYKSLGFDTQLLYTHPRSTDGKAVAWLHDVVQGDGEPDQALSFSKDSFPLDAELGFRSLGAKPLFTQPTTDLSALTALVGKFREYANNQRLELLDDDYNDWDAAADELQAAIQQGAVGNARDSRCAALIKEWQSVIACCTADELGTITASCFSHCASQLRAALRGDGEGIDR